MVSDHKMFDEMPQTLSKYTRRVILKSLLSRDDGGVGIVNERAVVGGWVKSSRELRKDPPAEEAADGGVVGPRDLSCLEVLQSRIPFFLGIIKVLGGRASSTKEKLDSVTPKLPPPSISVLQVSDGSCVASLQVLVDSSLASPSQVMATGTCLLAEGILQQPSSPGKHVIELRAERIIHLGTVDQSTYPLSKKRLPLERLRDSAHFSPRTTTVASVMRTRNALTEATHTFFQIHGFLQVQVPIITSTDSEGHSEKLQVTARLGKELKKEDPSFMDEAENVSLEEVQASLMEKTKKVEELKRSESNEEALVDAIHDFRKTNDLAVLLKKREKSKYYLKTENFKFSEDFFSCQTYLTVSGRLHLESFACSLGNVYSFGPRFRAEKSESTKSIAEMWMVEIEMAFSELEDATSCAEDFLKFLSKWILERCSEDTKFMSKRVDSSIIDRLQLVMSSSFQKISYAEAVEVLKRVTEKTFETKIELGVSLAEEHECYLAEEIYKRPVILYNHPKKLKSFYARLNDDGETVAAFDVVVPKVGALIRGSQSEERLSQLSNRIKELGLRKEQYEWYLDLRKHGSVKHSGFSLVFDLMILYATGLNDARDAVPFSRYYGRCNN